MKVIRFLIVAAVLSISLTAYSQEADKGDVLFQVSTVYALLEGVYDGDVTFEELSKHGDFGIGTFDRLDGEMILLDGEFYRVRADGKVYAVKGEDKTPFAIVTFFSRDRADKVEDIAGLKQLKERIDELLPTRNLFYAIKVEGSFKYVKTRSVPMQTKPYPLLADIVKKQAIFEFQDVKGVLIGFWSPSFVKGVNVPGYHLHFITEDRSAGGHLLECQIENALVEMEDIYRFYMVLPEDEEFLKADLSSDKELELHKVEN